MFSKGIVTSCWPLIRGRKRCLVKLDGTAVAQINDGADGQDGDDYILTAQDKSDIANLVIQILPTAQGVSF